MKNRKRIVMFLCIFAAFFCGCGKDKKLEQFHTDMNTFLDEIQSISTEMDNIEPTSEIALTDTLSCLDAYNSCLTNLQNIEVPAQFSNIDTMIDEAADYMSKSNTLFHEVYEAEPDLETEDPLEIKFDEEKYQTALEYYNRSMKRIGYISLLLQGEIDELETFIE